MASAPAPDAPASFAELFRSDHAAALTLVCLGIWLHAGDELMVATITPAMVGEIGGEPFIGWLTALYEVGSITASALGAWLAERVGVRKALALAGLVYALGCAASGWAPTMPGVLAGRLVQGLGGGAIVAVSLIAAWRMFPGRLLPRAVGFISLIWGIAAFAGPMVGAAFVEWGHWRGAFTFFGAQALFYVVSLFVVAPMGNHPAETRAGFPLGRMLVLSAGVIAVATAGVVRETAVALSAGAAGIALVWAFLKLDARAGDRRLLPVGAADPASPAGATLLLVFGLSSGAIALLIYGPVLIGVLHGLSAFFIGIVLVLESVGWSIASLLVSGVRRDHESKLIVGGAAVVLAGVIGLGATIAFGPVGLIPVFAIFQGAGFGLAWTFVIRRGAAIVGAADSERATSAINTIQRLGYAIGAATIGIAANRAGLHVGMGPDEARRITVIVFALTLVPAMAGVLAARRFVRFPEPER